MSLYTDASLIMYPSGYKEDKIYSLKPTDGSGDLTFTRASTATRVNAEGLIETSPVNLLKSTSDLSTQSTYWTTNQSGTSIQNAAIAPDGTTTASQITSTGGQFSGIAQNGISVSAVPYTYSCYLKATSGTPTIRLTLFDGVTFHQTNLTITSEWVRYSFTFTPIAGTFGVVISCSSVNTWLAWGAQVNSGSTAKPYFPTTDRLNVPRIDYTGDLCGKLLLEKQSTNLITYSEDFSNVDWSKYNVTITANVTTSPDGTINASKYLDSTTNDTHNLYKAFSISGDTTFSIYVKSAEYTRFAITNLSDGGDVLFNLSTVAVISTSGNFQNGKIDSIGNGWYRVSATTNGTSGGKAIGFSLVNNSGATSFVGTGTKGVYVWGAQAEASSYPASYIPTLASSVTRLADAGTTNIASSVNASEGVLFLDYQPLNVSTSFPVDFQLQYNGTNAVNGVTIYHSGNTPAVTVRSGGNIIFEQALTATTVGTRNKIALAYKGSDFAVYQNGLQKGTQSSGVAPAALNELRLSDGLRDFSINQAIIFPTRLTNAQLATLTTL